MAQIELTDEDIDLVLEAINTVNWPGRLIEQGVAIKKKFAEARSTPLPETVKNGKAARKAVKR